MAAYNHIHHIHWSFWGEGSYSLAAVNTRLLNYTELDPKRTRITYQTYQLFTVRLVYDGLWETTCGDFPMILHEFYL